MIHLSVLEEREKKSISKLDGPRPIKYHLSLARLEMDYNLKKENRKKFQDKSKLKRHHKKDYSKVVKNDNVDNNTQQPDEEERPREFDVEGNPVLYSDEELDLEGNIVLKGTTNDFRYKEVLVEDADDLKEYRIDFNKNFNEEFGLGGKGKKKLNKLTTNDLLNLKIVDKDFDSNEEKGDSKRTEKFEYQYIGPIKSESHRIKEETKVPRSLKSDEDFLDDLL